MSIGARICATIILRRSGSPTHAALTASCGAAAFPDIRISTHDGTPKSVLQKLRPDFTAGKPARLDLPVACAPHSSVWCRKPLRGGISIGSRHVANGSQTRGGLTAAIGLARSLFFGCQTTKRPGMDPIHALNPGADSSESST